MNRSIKLFLFIFLPGIIFGQHFKFAAMSDSRGPYNGVNDPVLSALVDHLIQNNPDIKFLLFAGDMVNGNKQNPELTFKQLLHWKDVMAPLYDNPDIDVWVSVGNHEIQRPEDEETFKKVFPYLKQNGPENEIGLAYSFNVDQVHFSIVDTDRWYYGDKNDTTDDKRDWHTIRRLDWLKKDIANAKSKGVKKFFVSGHEMPFPTGGHLRDGLPNLGRTFTMPLDSTRQWYINRRDEFWNFLSDNNVIAYICGHEHLYSRLSYKGVYQIINGSGGAPLYFFNPLYGDNPDTKIEGKEMTYDEAVRHYKVLNYNYGPGQNSQISKDFVGLRAFHYSVYEVFPDRVEVKTYGSFPAKGLQHVMGTEIKLIDEFIIDN